MTDSLLRDRSGRLRIPWRALLFVVPLAAFAGAAPYLPWASVFVREYIAIATVVLSIALLRSVDGKPAGVLGLLWTSTSGKHAMSGTVAGGALAFLAVAIAATGGASYAIIAHDTGEAVHTLLNQIAVFGTAAVLEELVVHGYLFQLALERLSGAAAVVLFALAFAALHLTNAHVDALAMTNTALAGILFGVAFIRTRQLWLPIFMHASWNVMEGAVLGTPVSGMSVLSILRIDLHGSVALTGGEYGPEAGYACTVVLLVGLAVMIALRGVRMAPEQYALLHRMRYAEDRKRVLREGPYA